MRNILLFFLIGIINLSAQNEIQSISNEIVVGNFFKARRMIDSVTAFGNMSSVDKYELLFQKDILERIEKDFTRDEAFILNALKPYFPHIDRKMLEKWEKSKALEMRVINGEKKYFKQAVNNLFRIDKDAKKVKEKIDGIKPDALEEFLKIHVPGVVRDFERTGGQLLHPVRMNIKYTLKLKPNAVPAGEIVRCWLPYPRENHQRQANVKLISINSPDYIISPKDFSHRTIYLEKKAQSDNATEFQYEIEFTAYSEYFNLKDDTQFAYNKDSELYKTNTQERFPHIIFSDKVKEISAQILGKETNPYKKVKLFIEWIGLSITWASAREYSTIPEITNYCLENMYGDCGIKSLLFITLCRYNGIPAKWQSGWMLHPGSVNLHDWAEVYFENYGWVPIDPDFGYQSNDNPKVKYFYTNGIDSYRFIVNDDYGQPLFPSKIFPRSETVDFQRGEVEWRGGNLYFDTWNYNMEVTYLNEDENEK